MTIIRFLWYTLLCLLLFTCVLVAVVGALWTLRVAIFWWLDIDYVDMYKEWLDRRKRNGY